MKTKVVLIRSGVHDLLNSQTVADTCTALAGQIVTRCGPGWAADQPHKTGQRVAVNVYAATAEAAADNAANDTARRAVQSMEVLL